MDFELSEEARAMQASTREVVDDLLQLEPEFHRTGVVPAKVDQTLASLGYMGISIPEEFGGIKGDRITSAVIQMELARMPPEFWPLIRAAAGPIPDILVKHGNRRHQMELLPKIASGEIHVSIALTEPGAGSDVLAMKTTARRDGDSWVINGTKMFISNANRAAHVAVFAYTDRSAGRKGISMILVPKENPGMKINGPFPTMGWMVDGLYEISFEDCRVPIENLAGEEGMGFHYVLEGLNEARLNVGCQAIGGGDIALEKSIDYAKQRVTFGVPLASHQAVQHMLADMAIDQHASRQLLLEAMWSSEHGKDVRLKSSMVKVYCTEAACRVADKAVQIHGGAGYIRGMVVERVYRDLRVLRIYEGASEIHRNMIAKLLLK